MGAPNDGDRLREQLQEIAKDQPHNTRAGRRAATNQDGGARFSAPVFLAKIMARFIRYAQEEGYIYSPRKNRVRPPSGNPRIMPVFPLQLLR